MVLDWGGAGVQNSPKAGDWPLLLLACAVAAGLDPFPHCPGGGVGSPVIANRGRSEGGGRPPRHPWGLDPFPSKAGGVGGPKERSWSGHHHPPVPLEEVPAGAGGWQVGSLWALLKTQRRGKRDRTNRGDPLQVSVRSG